MGFPKDKEKMVVIANYNNVSSCWDFDNLCSKFPIESVYICIILGVFMIKKDYKKTKLFIISKSCLT